MRICGIQKLTLLDWPGRVACTVFTGGCDLRCPFCHNSGLVLAPGDEPEITQDEVLALLQKRRGILDGVCVTGGEPLLQPGLEAFLGRIKDAGFGVKLDTNGCHPERLQRLLDAGLADYVAMDIKAARENYPRTVGIPDFDIAPVLASASLLMGGATPHEFRTTVVKGIHTSGDFADIALWLSGAGAYFLQGFVDSGYLIAPEGLSAFSKEEMQQFLNIVQPLIPSAQLRGVD